MNRREFLGHRAAFCGLPFGELTAALARIDAGMRWEVAFLAAARKLRRLAAAWQAGARRRSAVDGWLWAAAAYQVASFGLHFAPEAARWQPGGGRLARLRRLAEICYLRALDLDSGLGRAVAIPAAGGGTLRGYWRLPPGGANGADGAVVLLNGLDSICEVELHRFGDAFLRRGLAVLALRLPEAAAPTGDGFGGDAGAGGARRAGGRGGRGGGSGACNAAGAGLGYRAELAAPSIASWIDSRPGLAGRGLGCFGVSFGGHLALRLLAAEPRFAAGVAVSAPAWLDAGPACAARIRRMLALTFGLPEGAGLERYAAAANLDRLPAPEGRLLALAMERDELFGADHLAAIGRWVGRDRFEVRTWAAEHVGTSRIHHWLPDACDWLHGVLAALQGASLCTAR